MIRVVIENLILFLLPTALYVSFAVLRRPAGTTSAMVFSQAPVLTLSLLGASLVIAVMVMFGNVGDGKPGQAYEPAVFKDGKVVPGRMK
jgi:Family of unknown function (DUF6111)